MDNVERTSARPSTTSTSPGLTRGFRYFWLALLAVNLTLVAIAIPSYVQGAADHYHNEHARSIVGPLGSAVLCCAIMVDRMRIKVGLLAAAFLLLGMQFWLSWR